MSKPPDGFAQTYGVELLCEQPPSLERAELLQSVRKYRPNAELMGAALKYATTELYYAIDGDNDVDAIPGGILIQNKYLDASFDYSAVFS